MPKKKGKAESSRWTRELRNALTVFVVSAVTVGIAYMWSHADSRGRVTAHQLLLSPAILTGEVSLADLDSMNRLQRAWVFDSVDFYHAPDHSRLLMRSVVAPSAYEQLYKLIGEVRSLRTRSDLRAYFEEGKPSVLILTMTPTGPTSANYQPSQVVRVEFAEGGDLFRIEHEQGWVYFRQAGIGQQVAHLLTSGSHS